MKTKRNIHALSLAAFLVLGMGTAGAETQQVVTIDGETVSGTVKTVEFSGDDVILTFTDGTQSTKDMSLVNIALTYTDESTAVSRVDLGTVETDNRIFGLDGKYLGTDESILPRGLYIRGGKKLLIK